MQTVPSSAFDHGAACVMPVIQQRIKPAAGFGAQILLIRQAALVHIDIGAAREKALTKAAVFRRGDGRQRIIAGRTAAARPR